MDRIELIEDLAVREPDAIVRTLAMMAYNPAIGRVLERNGVSKFEKLMTEAVSKLATVSTRPAFDGFHEAGCESIRQALKTNKGVKLSYGQAQKPLNVFLKVYVAWAKLPAASTAELLQSFLHVPLDSVLMKFVKEEFPAEYRQHVQERCAKHVSAITKKHTELSERIIRDSLFNDFGLVTMSKPIYLAWQELLRSIYPERPILLDTIWATQRGRADEALNDRNISAKLSSRPSGSMT